jgi:hypothetical protein
MYWYVSYRTGSSTVMHVFKKRELAVAAAVGFSRLRFSSRARSRANAGIPWRKGA